MPTNKKDTIYECSKSSLTDIASFARFVNYAEGLTQLDELFKNSEDKENYEKIWCELEIINALALSQWEQEGCPSQWKTQWELNYKKDASDIIDELLRILM